MAVEYRVRTGDDGAFENGEEFPVTGEMLSSEGNPLAPAFTLERFDPKRSVVEETLDTLPDRYVMRLVNALIDPDSIVCRREAEDCDSALETMAKQLEITVEELGIPVFMVSNEPAEAHQYRWKEEVGLKHVTLLSSANSDEFGKDGGAFMATLDGRLQRVDLGIVNRRIVHSEYEADQGGPIPDFKAAVNAVRNSPALS